MRFSWRSALGIGLSAALVWWALQRTPWAEVSRGVAQANVLLLIATAIAATGIFPLRARRWRTILDPVAPALPFGPLWRATAIGMMVNNIVPARAGELARAYALSREVPAVPFSTAFASLAVDRVFDLLVVLLLTFAAMLDPRFPRVARIGSQSQTGFAIVGVSLSAGLLVALYLLVLFPDRVIALYEAFTRRVAPSIEARGRNVLKSFAGGLSVLRSPRRFSAVFMWALVHWLLNAFAFWLAFKAVHVEVPLSAALFVQGIICFGVALPSSPGFAGVFEVSAMASLGIYGIANGPALTWAVCFHVVSYIPITVIGVWYFTRLGLTFGELRGAGRADASEAG